MSTLTEAVSDASVITKRNLIKIKRVPDLVVWTTMMPIMFVLLFAYVFGGAIEVPGVGVEDIAVRRPTLDDVFLSLTGHDTHEHDDDTTDELEVAA